MTYFEDIFKKFTKVVKEQVTALNLKYSDTCDPQWWIKGGTPASGDKFVKCLLNVYPKEWLITEITQDGLLKYDFEKLRSFEPFWKLIAANKAMLPLLWSMYPNHPNLLPAFYTDPKTELKSQGQDFFDEKL